MLLLLMLMLLMLLLMLLVLLLVLYLVLGVVSLQCFPTPTPSLVCTARNKSHTPSTPLHQVIPSLPAPTPLPLPPYTPPPPYTSLHLPTPPYTSLSTSLPLSPLFLPVPNTSYGQTMLSAPHLTLPCLPYLRYTYFYGHNH